MKKETAFGLLEKVRRGYQEIAVDFNKTRQKEIWPEIKIIVAQVAPGAAILDVGCGNGRLLSAFSEKKIEYVGVDNSEALINLARQNFPDNKFLIDDILELKTVPDAYFDYIFCLAVLPHIPGKDMQNAALRRLKTKLKPNGRIYISAWNLRSAAWRHKPYRKLLWLNFFKKISGFSDLDFGDIIFPWKKPNQSGDSDRYYHAFRSRELKKLVQSAGLRLINFKEDKFNYWLEIGPEG